MYVQILWHHQLWLHPSYDLFMICRDTSFITPQLIADSWYDEINDYDFNNPGMSRETLYFTQVVWAAMTALV